MSAQEQFLAPADRARAASEQGGAPLGERGTIPKPGRRQLRIVLYAPGIAGLGHMRRTC